MSVSAATFSGNTGIRVMDTVTRLYYDSDANGTEETEITVASNTWTSSTGSESCIGSLNSVTKAFTLSCSTAANYAFTGGSKTWNMKFTTEYKRVENLPAAASVV